MRMRIIKTGLTISMLILILMPTALWLSDIQSDLASYDAEHVIRPLLSLYSQNAANSAHSPVDPLMDIEDIWALEDERTQADHPLVSGMRNGDSVLGYDAASQTFFCTIGCSFEDESWPELALYGQSSDIHTPVHIAWVSDYMYDSPVDAVYDGYAYELFAYTENEFQYFNIVFTGLPIVTLQTESSIPFEYIPACVNISTSEHESITSMAQVHQRGGGYGKPIDKPSYRIEFQALNRSGRSVAYPRSVLGMPFSSDWLLLANASNVESVHNYLAFDLWNRWSEGEHLFMQQQSKMVELFVGNEYMGLYQLIEAVNYQQEIRNAGGNTDTDMVARLISPMNYSDRPIRDIHPSVKHKLECVYVSGTKPDRVFSTASIYSSINDWLEQPLTDEEFTQLVQKHVDIENFISLFLFYQIAGLTTDNARNNLFIYMLHENGTPILHLAPWDMDCAFFYGYFSNPEHVRFCLNLKSVVRMLDLNIMNCREMLHSMYQSRCETILTDSAIDEWIIPVEQNIGISSAYLRESEKWYGEPRRLDLSDLLAFEKEQVVLTSKFYNERWPLE